MPAVKVASVQAGVWEHRDRRRQSRSWWFIDIDDLDAINVHAQPLSFRSIRRLIGKGPTELLMDKRSEAMLPAGDRTS